MKYLQQLCQTTNVIQKKSIFFLIFGLLMAFSSIKLFAQCPGNITDGGTISANVTTGSAPLTVYFNNDVAPVGPCGTCAVEVMYIIIENGVASYFQPNTYNYSYTFNNTGNMEVFRCTRYTGCSSWPGESNHLFISVTSGCSNVTNAGVIGYDETFCGSSFDPSLIQDVASPSGGTGTIEYVWLETTDINTVNGTAWNVTGINGASSSTYDPGVITQTTWYRRCSRRSGCSNWDGESNWVKKEVTNCCNNVTNGGTIGYNETFCGSSFDPALIQNTTSPSGGAGGLEYVWLISYDGGNNYSVISGAIGASYDPGVITQTTWYRRCARRAGCSSYIGESNWVEKAVNPAITGLSEMNQNDTCGHCTGAVWLMWHSSNSLFTATINGSNYSNFNNGTVWNNNGTWQLDIYGLCAGNYTAIVTDSITGCSSTLQFTINNINVYPTANAGLDKFITCTTTTATIGTAAVAGNTYSWSNGVTTATQTVNPSATTSYTLTVTNSNGCTSTDVVVVNVNTTVPSSNAGSDKNITCSTTTATLGIAAVAGNTYSWSNGVTTATQTVNPSATTSYTLTVTNTASGCTATDVVVVNVNTTAPSADAGSDKNITCTTTTATIGTASVAGNTYSWSNGVTTATQTVNPSATTSYTLTVTNTASGCTSTDVVVVNVNTTAPSANAGSDKNITCTTTTATIGTAAVAGNTYSWSNGVTTATQTVNPSATTSYTLTVTNTANACTATDVVVVNVNTTVPIADAGIDKSITCLNTSSIIGTSAVVGNSYSWSPSTGLNSSSIPQPTVSGISSSQTYTLTVTNGASGCIASDVVVVNLNTSPPTVDAGLDKNLDCSNTNTTIGTPSIAGNTYSWSPTTALSSSTIAMPTTNTTVSRNYMLTVTGANGCTATDIVSVNVNSTPPIADAGVDKVLNCTTTSTTIGSSSATGNIYSWSPSTGLNNPNISMPTANPTSSQTYTLTVTGSNGCTTTDVVIVNMNNIQPNADAGIDKDLTCTVTSTQIGTTGLVGKTYSWSPSTGLNSTTVPQPIANPTTTQTYTVTVTANSNGCSATDVVTVNVNTTAPNANAGMDQTVTCTNTSATIGIAAVSGNTYSWSNGVNTAIQTVNPTVPTTYTLTVTNTTSGCTATDVVFVDVNTTAPNANAGMDQTVTCTTTSATIGTAAVSGNTYSWSNSVNTATQTVNPTVPTTYTLTVTNTTSGCTATDVVFVDVNTTVPNANAGMDQTVTCTTTSATIGTVAVAGNTYSWSNGSSNATQTISPTSTTSYTLIVTNTASGCTSTDVVIVYVNQPIPNSTITGNMEVCNGSTTTLSVSSTVGNILWSNNATTNQITVGAGTYSVTVTDGVCMNTSTVTVITTEGSIGNYVWYDLNLNGIQDEGVTSGINNATVELWSPGADNTIGGTDDIKLQTTSTANDINGNSGYYKFIICNDGNYYVKFPTVIGGDVLTATNQASNTNLNSDANGLGNSEIVTINVHGTGVAKDNNTIDAGYIGLKYIGNRVWYDVNQNGIQDPNEIGVARVTVSLLNATTLKQISSTVTDAYGYYLFNNLSTGDYKLVFTLPSGYVFTIKDAGTDNEFDSDVDPSTGITDLIAYQGGTIDLSFDAGIYQPNPVTATLGDKVWNDVDKDGIQDPTEVGVANVTVTLFNSNGDFIASTITNSNGEYNFTKIEPGTYYVNFSLPIGYLFTTPSAGTNPNEDSKPSITTGNTPLFTLVGGDNITNQDAGIYSQTSFLGSIGNYVWNDFNNNGIQDSTEAGVSYVTVTLFDGTGNTLISTTHTDKFGHYIFNGLPAGNYVVGFSDLPTGFTFVTSKVGTNDEINSDPNPSTGKTAIINLLTGQVITSIDAGINNLSLPAAALGDYIWYDRNEDGIQESGENGVPGVTVKLFSATGALISTTVSDILGRYIFNNLASGDYYINISNLPAGNSITESFVGTDSTKDSNIDPSTQNSKIVTLGTDEINLSIDAGIISNNGLRKSSSVIGDFVWNDANSNGIQDAGELGVQGVTVTLYQENGISILATTTTNSLGEYTFNDLPEGNYIVGFSNLPIGFTFSPANQGTDPEIDANVDANMNGKSAVIVLGANEVNQTIDAGIHQAPGFASIGDLVWNDINQNGIQDLGEPGVTGITVTLFNTNNEVIANTTTDANGNYQFIGLIPGDYKVTFTNLPANYSFTTPNATNNSQDNLDSDADPITGTTQIITVLADQYNTSLDAGIFTLKASLGNYVWEDVNYNGIQDPNESGISGVTVTLFDANNIPVTMAITDAKGQYNFVNLEPGTYSIGLSNIPVSGIYSPENAGTNGAIDSDIDPITGKSRPVTLVASEYNPNLDAGIYLPGGTGLGNYVWLDADNNNIQDPGETGVAGVTVILNDVNGNPIKATITDQYGAYTFSNLVPGTYSVEFTTLPVYYRNDGTKLTTSFVTPFVGTNNTIDSDVDPSTGNTPQYTIVAGEYNPTVDAGIKFSFALPAQSLEAISAVINNDNTIGVNYKTVTESNTKFFEIERSYDNLTFEKAGTQEASGNTVGSKNYLFNDNISSLSKKDIIYYRIKLVDIDGKTSISNVINIRLANTSDEVVVFPSLFSNYVNVLYQAVSASNIDISITDFNGQVVSQKSSEIGIGKNIITVDNLNNLATGIYMIKIVDSENNAKYIFKLNKQ